MLDKNLKFLEEVVQELKQDINKNQNIAISHVLQEENDSLKERIIQLQKQILEKDKALKDYQDDHNWLKVDDADYISNGFYFIKTGDNIGIAKLMYEDEWQIHGFRIYPPIWFKEIKFNF